MKYFSYWKFYSDTHRDNWHNLIFLVNFSFTWKKTKNQKTDFLKYWWNIKLPHKLSSLNFIQKSASVFSSNNGILVILLAFAKWPEDWKDEFQKDFEHSAAAGIFIIWHGCSLRGVHSCYTNCHLRKAVIRFYITLFATDWPLILIVLYIFFDGKGAKVIFKQDSCPKRD